MRCSSVRGASPSNEIGVGARIAEDGIAGSVIGVGVSRPGRMPCVLCVDSVVLGDLAHQFAETASEATTQDILPASSEADLTP